MQRRQRRVRKKWICTCQQNPKISLDQKLTPKKSPADTLFTGLRGRDTRVNDQEPSHCFEQPQKSLLKSSHQKNTCQIFLPKNSRHRKFETPKKSFDHPRLLKSEVLPLGCKNRCFLNLFCGVKHTLFSSPSFLSPLFSVT